MSLRVICRLAILHDNRLLLVRNRGLEYWYPPGGGWERGETLPECGAREVLEETHLHANVGALLYVQEFYGEGKHERALELIFLASLVDGKSEPHIPEHEHLAEARWFSREEVQGLTVYPPQLKGEFWEQGRPQSQRINPYIGAASTLPAKK